MERKTLKPAEAQKIILEVIDEFAIDGDELDAIQERELVRDRLRDVEWMSDELAALDKLASTGSQREESGPNDSNVISLEAFRNKRAVQICRFDENYEAHYEAALRTATRNSETKAEQGWNANPEARLAPVERAGSTHVLSLQWFAQGKVPVVHAVMLFVDGKVHATSNVRQNGRNLWIYVHLLDQAGAAIPLDQCWTCLEDDQTVRIQCLTKITA